MKNSNLKSFYNDGFGWKCRKCEGELKKQKSSVGEESRLMREGEAESKSPEFSNLAMAKWKDSEKKMLICPRCGMTESII